MRKKCCIAVICCLLAVILPLQAQHPWLLHRYDETNSQLQGHPTMMLQDRSGLLWIATWNGLCRFDGYEFRPIKPQAGDGCSMSSDRLRDIWLAENGDIYCRTDDGIFRFDIKSACRFIKEQYRAICPTTKLNRPISNAITSRREATIATGR